MSYKDNDRFLDWLEEQRLKNEGYSFHYLDQESEKDLGLRREQIRALEQVIKKL